MARSEVQLTVVITTGTGLPTCHQTKRFCATKEKPYDMLPFFSISSEGRTIESAIREVCAQLKYELHAFNARTNHVHSVVSAPHKPEHVLNSFKAYATRKLREKNLIDERIRPWGRQGSTPYLWTEEDLEERSIM